MVLLKAYIPEDLKARVDACAAKEQRTIKAVVVRALESYLAEDIPEDVCERIWRERIQPEIEKEAVAR